MTDKKEIGPLFELPYIEAKLDSRMEPPQKLYLPNIKDF